MLPTGMITWYEHKIRIVGEGSEDAVSVLIFSFFFFLSSLLTTEELSDRRSHDHTRKPGRAQSS